MTLISLILHVDNFGCPNHGACQGVRGQLSGVSSLLPACPSPETELGCSGLGASALPAEPGSQFHYGQVFEEFV